MLLRCAYVSVTYRVINVFRWRFSHWNFFLSENRGEMRCVSIGCFAAAGNLNFSTFLVRDKIWGSIIRASCVTLRPNWIFLCVAFDINYSISWRSIHSAAVPFIWLLCFAIIRSASKMCYASESFIKWVFRRRRRLSFFFFFLAFVRGMSMW